MAQAAHSIVLPGKKLLFQYTTSSRPAEEAGCRLTWPKFTSPIAKAPSTSSRVSRLVRHGNHPRERAADRGRLRRRCACATCHVYVDPEWLGRLNPPGPDENMMLDEAFEVRDNSRLSCQIKYGDVCYA